MLIVALLGGMQSTNTETYHHCDVVYQQSEATVYVTRTGTRFHRGRCQYVKNRPTRSMTRTKAVDYGYIACKVCKP